MADDRLIVADGIKWWDVPNARIRTVEPICLQHNLRLSPVIVYTSRYVGAAGRQLVPEHTDKSIELLCDEGDGHKIKLPRPYGREKSYVTNKIDAQNFAKMKTINLDDSMVPVAAEELRDTDYWVKAKITESKSGTRLLLWAGSKKAKNKAQLFVEPELKRMSFDQNDDHPTEVFARVEATFVGDVTSKIEKF